MNKISERLSDFTNKEMTRKEFLATLGVGVATIAGFGTIINYLRGNPITQQPAPQTVRANTYGSMPYGGKV